MECPIATAGRFSFMAVTGDTVATDGEALGTAGRPADKVYLRSEDAFVITCVANLMEVKVLYVKQVLPYEISSYWRFNV
jgi:hypothetical protein